MAIEAHPLPPLAQVPSAAAVAPPVPAPLRLVASPAAAIAPACPRLTADPVSAASAMQLGLAGWLHERLQQALVLADAEGNVFSANAAAQGLELEVDALAIRNGRLEVSEANQAELLAALRVACERGAARLVRLEPSGEEPRYMAVSPLDQPGAPRLAVCLLGPRCPCSALTLQWFAQRHALTLTETVVLQELCTGATPQQIAARRGVGLSTVRTQIACIRDKAELHTIRDLVRVVLQLPAVRQRVPQAAAPARMAPPALEARRRALAG